MFPNLPISSLDRQKKDLLVLPREEFLLLVLILLNGNQSDAYTLEHMLKTAARTAPSLGSWRRGSAELLARKLGEKGFIGNPYRKVHLDPRWRVPLFFATDNLRPEEIVALIRSVNQELNFPEDGSHGNHWYIRYEDVQTRLLHKILLDQQRDFTRLLGLLTDKRRYYETAQEKALRETEQLIATIAPEFWGKRSGYFRWLHFNQQQFCYPHWEEDTPARLLPILLELSGTEDFGEYAEDTRSIVLLGMHYFRQHPEVFRFDPGLQGVMHLINGNPTGADLAFLSLPPVKEEATIVDVIALARAFGAGQVSAPELLQRSQQFKASAYPALINCFLAYVRVVTGQVESGEVLLEKQLKESFTHPLEWMVALWSIAWTGLKPRQTVLPGLFKAMENDEFSQIPWVLAEVYHTLLLIFPHQPAATQWQQRLEELARTQVQEQVFLLRLLPVKAPWEYALRQLQRTSTTRVEAITEAPQFRTIWIVDFDQKDIFCKEQKAGARGWSKGRKLRWHEIISPKNPEAMDPADSRATAAITTYDGRRLSASMVYNDESLRIDFGRMLHEIADHPRIYLDDKKRIPIELIRSEPELRISETPNGLLLQFDPPVEVDGYVWRKETPTRYRVYHLTEKQGKIAWAIGSGVEVPASERSTVENIVEDIRPAVAVQSTFDLIDESLEQIPGSSRPCVHLLPYGDGYQVAIYAKPVPEEPLYFKPGDGLPRTVVVLEDGRHLLLRDLREEVAATEALLTACPTLRRISGSHYEYVVEETQTALRILLELRRLVEEEQITIEHPKGEKLKIVGEAGSDSLAIRVGKQRDWFEVDGQLTVDEDRVLNLELLLEQLRERKDNPFVELKEGEFIALTDELRDRILEMEGLLHQKGKKLQLPTLAAGAFSDVTASLEDLEVDLAWTESLERIKLADKIRPRVPKDFRAELRDYQKDGFRWLMRLAAWGVGGCLADDMGLGKTVQALAMLCARAAQGPALVIAPASVTRNWQAETERFAPGLIPVLIASRQDTVHLPQLGSGDLALVSYGLLSFIGEELQAIDWATIVLDEAQAIKNTATKRAKIVQGLSGDFKLATTGTPIENHLGELWSLFRFLNPGLLGGKSAFNEKFNRPIARDGDEDRRRQLKNLVKPFILRRRKDEVLTELPPKTEIQLSVELSEEEKALYEALRRQALKEIAAADEQQKRFTVLAQLTRLRQAACHPRLVRPASKIGSAKLELVGETLLEILENGHKALIFSQFVKHLKIVENWVKGQGITYQYLDGSTPGKKREEAVNAFQAGEGEVFLISLKAGGTGLNLTAADYVLHLDPWWNPATEDQASDRAHRIGQQRPVTVYRFVSEGTIEEQIIALHAEKRDLADQILSGTGNAGKLGVEEILALMRE